MLNVYLLYCLVILSCCSQTIQTNKYMHTNYKHVHIDVPTYESMNTHTQIYTYMYMHRRTGTIIMHLIILIYYI